MEERLMAKTKYEVVSAWDPKITLKKFFTGLLMAEVPFVADYTINFLEEEASEIPPEYALYIPLIVAVVHAALNWWKHRNDTKKVKV